MCLALPGKVVSVDRVGDIPSATVDFSGVQKRVSLAFCEEAEPGMYVIVHVGFALRVLDEQAAKRTLDEVCG